MNPSINLPSNQIKLSSDVLSSLIKSMNPQVTLCGYQKQDPLAVCDTRVLSENELIFIISGTLLVTISEQTYALSAGFCILIPAFTPHKINVDPNDLPTNCWAHFTCENEVCARDFFQQIHKLNQGYQIKTSDTKEFLSLWTSFLSHAFLKEAGNTILSQSYFLILFLETMKLCISDDSLLQPNAITDELFLALYAYAQKEFLHIHCVADLAKPLNISVSYCSQLFRKHAKTSPMKFIMLEKLKYSEHLLRSNYPIIKISEMLGFSSPYHFSNMFRQYYSMSPTEYKSRRYDL